MIEHQIHNSLGNYTYNAFLYRNRSYAEHFHRNFELIYVQRGALKVEVQQREVTLLEGEMLLLSPYLVHAFTVSGETTVWVGVFSGDFVHGFASKHGHRQFSKFRCEEGVEQFLRERLFYQGVPPLYEAKACLYLVCQACLLRAEAVDLPMTQGFRSAVIEYLGQACEEGITMRQAAAAMGYEYHYFSRLFHECFGLNFKEFLNILRFDRACVLLEQGEVSVTSLAERCGFGSIRNFNRIFLAMSGVTPTEYRRMYAERG